MIDRTTTHIGPALTAALLLIAAIGLDPAGAAACDLTVTQDITLTEDLVGCEGDGLVVTADDVTIDLNGHSILGVRKERTAGIRAFGVRGLTITNGTVAGFERGIYLYSAKDVSVTGVEVSGNRYQGLMVYSCSGVSVVESVFGHNFRSAIWIFDSDAELIRNLGVDNPNRTFYLSGGRILLAGNIARGGAYYSAFTMADGYVPASYSFGDNLAENIDGVGYMFAWGFAGAVTDLGGNRAVNTGGAECWTEDLTCPLDLDATSTGPVCGDGVCDPDESVCTCAFDCGPPPAEVCDDGADNDCDGMVDCDDADDCALVPACEPVPWCQPPGAACSTYDECCSGICRSSAGGATANTCR